MTYTADSVEFVAAYVLTIFSSVCVYVFMYATLYIYTRNSGTFLPIA